MKEALYKKLERDQVRRYRTKYGPVEGDTDSEWVFVENYKEKEKDEEEEKVAF